MTEELIDAEVVEPSTDLVPAEIPLAPIMSDSEIDRVARLATALARSNYFPSVKSTEQAFAKILLGRELGLSATQALTGLHVVEGGLMVAYPMLGQFIRSRPGYDYEVVEHDDEHAVIRYTVNGKVRGTSAFSVADAKRAGLIRGERSAWVKHPKNMVFARAMSNGVKWFVPEVTNGMPVYHEGEIEGNEPAPASAPPLVLTPEEDEAAKLRTESTVAQLRDELVQP